MEGKICGKCHITKPINEFGKFKNGYQSYCKECMRQYVRQYSTQYRQTAKRKESIRNNNERLSQSGYFREYHQKRNQLPEVKEQTARVRKLYRLRPDVKLKDSARTLLNHKIRSGEIERKPCSICGNSKTEAHHFDYSQPLLITWLCTKCHAKIHKAKYLKEK
jgi:ribosomal protein S27AE